jgi:hypothetical protein
MTPRSRSSPTTQMSTPPKPLGRKGSSRPGPELDLPAHTPRGSRLGLRLGRCGGFAGIALRLAFGNLLDVRHSLCAGLPRSGLTGGGMNSFDLTASFGLRDCLIDRATAALGNGRIRQFRRGRIVWTLCAQLVLQVLHVTSLTPIGHYPTRSPPCAIDHSPEPATAIKGSPTFDARLNAAEHRGKEAAKAVMQAVAPSTLLHLRTQLGTSPPHHRWATRDPVNTERPSKPP